MHLKIIERISEKPMYTMYRWLGFFNYKYVFSSLYVDEDLAVNSSIGRLKIIGKSQS